MIEWNIEWICTNNRSQQGFKKAQTKKTIPSKQTWVSHKGIDW